VLGGGPHWEQGDGEAQHSAQHGMTWQGRQ
jgi:hypothetical protein